MQCNVLDCISWNLLNPDCVELSIQGMLIFGRCHVDTSVRLATGTTLMLERKGRREDAKGLQQFQHMHEVHAMTYGPDHSMLRSVTYLTAPLGICLILIVLN